MSLTVPEICTTPGVSSGSAHGAWTQQAIRHRLQEAASTLRRLPLPKNGKPADLKTAWPDVAYEWLAYASVTTHVARIPPTPTEISRLDEALSWLWLLTRDQRLMLWGRANHWSYRKLCDLDMLERNGRGRTERMLRNVIDDAEHRILAHLNGSPRRMVLP